MVKVTYPNEKVLVACPTFKGKHYALEAYLSAYNAFSYPLKGLYMVDTGGDGLRYFEHLKSLKVDCDHLNPTRDWQETLTCAWKMIAEKAKNGNYNWICSIEQDNICPPLTLDVLLNIAGYCKSAHVAHGYPWHKFQSEMGLLIGLGCNLILTDLLVEIFSRDQWYTDAIESELYEYPKLKHYPTVEVYNLIDIQHMDDEAGVEYYQFEKPVIPKFTRGTTMEMKPKKYNIGEGENASSSN